MTDLKEAIAPPPTPPPPPPQHRALSWLAVAVVTASAVIGSNVFSVRDRLFGTATPKAAPPAAGRVAGAPSDAPAQNTSLRSQPWWQDVTVLEGSGPTTGSPFTVADGALQWRVRWSCTGGHLLVQAPKARRPVVDAACGQGGDGYGVGTGAVALRVTADGPWKLEVAQQVDAPLVEPPLPAMTAPGARAVSSGSFYRIDKTGTGKVTVYRQADGRYAIRLDDFFVSPTADLELRLSALEAPHSSQEFQNARSEVVTRMDVTAGSLNYPVPDGIDPTQFKSVVIWCAPIDSAYAAASLGPVR